MLAAKQLKILTKPENLLEFPINFMKRKNEWFQGVLNDWKFSIDVN